MADSKKNPCIHAKECGGCPLIGLPYEDQLQKKRLKILEAFRQNGFDLGQVKNVLKETRRSPKTLGYRNKAKWILQPDRSGRLKMGIYYPGTHDVVDIPECAVHSKEINEISAFIKSELTRLKVPCGNDFTDKKSRLRYMIIRYSFREKKLLAVFVTSASKVTGLDEVLANLTSKFSNQVVSIVQNINSDTGNVLLGEANRYIRKEGELTETFGNYRVPVGPLSFLQVNSFQASYLYTRVRALLGAGPFDSGLDLYSGVGLFALHMAPVTKKILAVEEVGPAALEAITASRRARIKNILQLCSDALDGISSFVGEFGTPDWVIVNPPRKGCDEMVLKALLVRPPKKLIYVSCNPLTLARDLSILMKEHSGFKLKTLEPVDMFPQTEHVECIALLENSSFMKDLEPTETSSPPRKNQTQKTKGPIKKLH